MCECKDKFVVSLGREGDYDKFKKILNSARHPTFIGRNMYVAKASNGGAMFYNFNDKIIAVSLVNPKNSSLLVLSVVREHREHGLGSAIMQFLIPNFVRALESKVGWFENRGYVRIGDLKIGRSLKTQIMAREKLFELAGNLNKAWDDQ